MRIESAAGRSSTLARHTTARRMDRARRDRQQTASRLTSAFCALAFSQPSGFRGLGVPVWNNRYQGGKESPHPQAPMVFSQGVVTLPDDSSFLKALTEADAGGRLVVLYFTANW